MTTYTKVADLTVEQLRGLIQEIIKQTFLEMFSDSDDGLELQETIKKRLQLSLNAMQSGQQKNSSAHDVAVKLGLEW